LRHLSAHPRGDPARRSADGEGVTMASLGKIARRTFLIGTGTILGGMAVGYYAYRRPFENPLEARSAEGTGAFNPYLTIERDGTITIIVPRAEMGQGVTTTLAALVAEELDVTLDQVTVDHGPSADAYANMTIVEEGLPFPAFDESTVAELARGGMGVVGRFLALQVTGGSTSTVDAFEKMRHAGAAAREVLKAAAAERWGVEASALATADGEVIDPQADRRLTYGELASDAAGRAVPRDLVLRAPSEWKLLGRAQPRTDMRAKVTGAPIFGIDVDLPDLLHATIRMNPNRSGGLLSFDPSAAEAMRGVVKVVEIDSRLGRGFAVIADNSWRAFMAADAVDVQWEEAVEPLDDARIWNVLEDSLVSGVASAMRDDGDVDVRFADAPREAIVEAEYRVPYLAHATMEPMNATARLRDGRLDIWAPNQAPNMIQSLCAAELGIERSDCMVHTTYLGGGFGRRGELDFALYAALLARETEGRPVKVTWTREEDMTHDMYRPAAIGRFRARLDASGMPEAVDMRIASPSVIGSVVPRYYPRISPPGPDKSIVDGAFNQPYAIENYRVAGIKAPLDIPVGFWRSVGNSYNGFFHECFMDEIAAESGIDPLDFRLRLMAPWPVATALLEKVAEMSNWRGLPGEGRERGLAFTLSFGTWVAQVVEVAETERGISVENVWCAADPGIVLDPGIFRAQIMSGIVHGLSSAMGEEITFTGGAARQTNFHDYEPMRIDRCPAIHVELLENATRMGGAGEPGTPPAIPALANAIHALTGKRIRQLPLAREVDFA
jgi:isoquinoline 1-oxidoreductase subunit beta